MDLFGNPNSTTNRVATGRPINDGPYKEEEEFGPSTSDDAAFMLEYGDFDEDENGKGVYFYARQCYWYRMLQLLGATLFVLAALSALHCGFAGLCSVDSPDPVESGSAMFPWLPPTASPSLRPPQAAYEMP